MKTGRDGFVYGLWLVVLFILLRSFYVPTFKFLTGSLHPLAIDTYIFLVSSIVLIFLLRGRLKNFLALNKKERKYFYMLIIPAAIGSLLLDLSILYLPVKAFVIFISAMPIIVGFYSSRFLKETPSKILWVAALLAAIGAIVFKSGSITGFGWGDLFIILGVFLFSFTPILNRKYIKKLGTKEIMFLDSLFILVPTITAALVLGVLALPPLNTYYIGTLSFMILVLVIGLGAVAVTVSRYLTAHMFTTLTTALIPIGATTIGIVALGETLLPQEIVGGGIMIGAALLASYFGSKERVK